MTARRRRLRAYTLAGSGCMFGVGALAQFMDRYNWAWWSVVVLLVAAVPLIMLTSREWKTLLREPDE